MKKNVNFLLGNTPQPDMTCHLWFFRLLEGHYHVEGGGNAALLQQDLRCECLGKTAALPRRRG